MILDLFGPPCIFRFSVCIQVSNLNLLRYWCSYSRFLLCAFYGRPITLFCMGGVAVVARHIVYCTCCTRECWRNMRVCLLEFGSEMKSRQPQFTQTSQQHYNFNGVVEIRSLSSAVHTYIGRYANTDVANKPCLWIVQTLELELSSLDTSAPT